MQDVRRGRYWSDQPLDAPEKLELERKLAELDGDVSEAEGGQWTRGKKEKDVLGEENREISTKIASTPATPATVFTANYA